MAIIVPQVALAAWWNPFSWGIWNWLFHFQGTEQQQEQTNVGKCDIDKDCPAIQCIKAPCPQNKCINHTCQLGLLWDDIYPFYAGVNWETVGPKKMTVPVSDLALEGYGVKGQGKINQNQDAQKFFNYYDNKLKSAGWAVENNFAADGVKGSQIGYKKGTDYIVLSYNITPGKVTSGENEPLQWTCPCQVQYDVFAGSAVSKNAPVAGGATAGWKTYTNTEHGFEIKYPSDWVVKIGGPGEMGAYSLLSLDINKKISDFNKNRASYVRLITEDNNFVLGTRDWKNFELGQIKGSISCDSNLCEIIFNSSLSQHFYIQTKNNPETDGDTHEILSTFKFTK